MRKRKQRKQRTRRLRKTLRGGARTIPNTNPSTEALKEEGAVIANPIEWDDKPQEEVIETSAQA